MTSSPTFFDYFITNVLKLHDQASSLLPSDPGYLWISSWSSETTPGVMQSFCRGLILTFSGFLGFIGFLTAVCRTGVIGPDTT